MQPLAGMPAPARCRRRSSGCHTALRLIHGALLISAVFAVLVLLPHTVTAQEKSHILVLHSYNKELTWTASEDAGIVSVLQPLSETIDVHTEYLDTKLVANGAHARNFLQLLAYKYRSVPFRVIICSDDDAYNFALTYREQLFPSAAIVFCGVNYYAETTDDRSRDFVTGVVEAFDIPKTLRTALRLHPNTKRIVVINDMTTTGLANKKILNDILPEFAGKAEFVFLEDYSMTELLAAVRSLSRGDIILLMTFNRDRIGEVFTYDDSIALIAKASQVPMYGVWDFYLGKGIVGGMLTSGADQGRLAAEMALRIIRGEAVRSIPVVKQSPNRYKFDYLQMQRFGIQPADLPPESTIVNQPDSFYDTHRELVWGLTAGFGSLSVIILLLLANIRQRKRVEDALRKSEERFRALFVENPSMYFIVDENGVILSVNPYGANQLGYGVDELVGTLVMQVFYPDDRTSVARHFKASLNAPGTVSHWEFRKIRKDGSMLWVREAARAVHGTDGNFVVFIVCEDITVRKQGEEALRSSEERFRTLVDNLNVGIYRSSADDRDPFIQVNPAMARIFGYDSIDEFLRSTPASHYQHEEDRRRFVERVAESGSVRDLELTMKKKDGSLIWISVNAQAHYDKDGQILWIDGVNEDVTERKKLEEQLRQAQKMEAIGTLAGGVAHDFNNILTALVGYSDILRLRMGEGNPLRSYVDDILAVAERATKVTQSLLAFSRKQLLSTRVVDLNDIVKRIDALLLRVIGEDIEFNTILTPLNLPVMADSGQIEQVLMNLAANARDAMPNGGILTIKTDRVDLNGEISGSFITPGAYAVISISDTGDGIDEPTRQRIFEPFFTTKEMGKGTGLGLSIVYGIIKQHNGEINVYSEPGRGTTFKIYLKLAETKVSAPENAEPDLPIGGTETILVAEDDADVRRFIKTVLEDFGYTVIEAIDGEDALEKFRTHMAIVQMLILDVVMPRKNGREAYEEMCRMKNAKIPALFASGYTADIIHKKGILDKEINFISKPISAHSLLVRVREVLSQ